MRETEEMRRRRHSVRSGGASRRGQLGLRGVSGFLERAIDVVPDLVFVKDRRLKYVLVNKAVCDFLRKSKDEILGRTAYDLYPKDMESRKQQCVELLNKA